MNDVIRVVLGSLFGAVAMFVVGFIFWATPLSALAYASAGEKADATVQQALAANLPHTGRYVVPSPASPGGTVLYGRGPVATIDYNMHGYAVADPSSLIGGFVQEFVAVLMIGFTLFAVARRVGDFASRARLVIGLSAAATVMITLSDPIFMHSAWGFAIYNLIACLAMLAAGGLVVARWFLPIVPAASVEQR